MNPQTVSQACLGEFRVALTILRLPGIPFAHAEKRHAIAERLQRPLLRRIDRAFDELHDRHLHPMAETSQRHSQRGSRFPLPAPV